MSIINKKKTADIILEEIRRMIQEKILKEGDKLPNQNEFAAQLGVSRPSLREAFQTLNMIGAIEQRPGYGTVLKSLTPALMAPHLMPPMVSNRHATFDLLKARYYIELGTVELAVKNASKENIKQLGIYIDEMTAALKKGKTKLYSDIDAGFHFHIAEAALNPFLLHYFATCRGQMEQFIQEAFSVLPRLLKSSLKFHKQIFKGIKQRDSNLAKASMSDHLNDVRVSFEAFYELSGKTNER